MDLDEPCIIDVEASGFGYDSYPVEVGVALGGGLRFCTLITPAHGWDHWTDEGEQTHGIGRDTLKTYGSSVDNVADRLNVLLEGKTVYSDGWVVDKPWIEKLYFTAGKSMSFSVSPLEMILTEGQMEIWHQTKDKVIREMKITRHRASNDAWVIQATYRQTRKLVASHS